MRKLKWLVLADIFGQTLAAIGTSGIHKAKTQGVVPAGLLAGFTGTLASAQDLLGGSGDLGATAAALQADLGQHLGSLRDALEEGDLKDKAGKLTEGLKGLLDWNHSRGPTPAAALVQPPRGGPNRLPPRWLPRLQDVSWSLRTSVSARRA